MVHFVIAFDKPDRNYKPGEKVHYYVYLTLEKQTDIKSFVVTVFGNAETSWRKKKMGIDKDGKPEENITNFLGQQTLFNNHLMLIESEDNAAVNIKAGQHSYDASFMLPDNLPQSYEGKCFIQTISR